MQTVKHLLERKSADVISVKPEDSVLHAIGIMAERHVGALLVMRERELLGVLSERDYARKVILKGRASHDTKVSEIMSSPVFTVTPADTVHRCMQIMTSSVSATCRWCATRGWWACCPSATWSRR